MDKTNKEEAKTFIAPKSNLKLSATDNLYLGVTRRSSNGLTFIYMLVSPRDSMGRYPMMTDVNVATFRDSATADIYFKTISDIMRWQSKSYLQQVRKYYQDIAANFYKQSR